MVNSTMNAPRRTIRIWPVLAESSDPEGGLSSAEFARGKELNEPFTQGSYSLFPSFQPFNTLSIVISS